MLKSAVAPVKTISVYHHVQLVKAVGPKHAQATVGDSLRHPGPGCHQYSCLAEMEDSGIHSDSPRYHQSRYARHVAVLDEPC